MIDQAQIRETIVTLNEQRRLLGDEVVATAVAVLRDLLASGEAVAARPDANEAAVAPSTVQRKQATILFANVIGLTSLAADERETEWLEMVNQLWQRLGEIITTHGGIVDKYMGDVVMGVFGVPFARENDPERAIHCALALQAGLNDFIEDVRQWTRPRLRSQSSPAAQRPSLSDLSLRIGINTGLVSLGEVGSDAEFTVIGDAVNVASRLEKFAPDSGVYISHDTYRLTGDLFQAEGLGRLQMKGRREPIPVYQIKGTRPRLFFPDEQGIEGVAAPMIGRDEEIGQLQRWLQSTARNGRGAMVIVSGEAGVGKSRLMREFNRWLERFPIKATIFRGRTEQRLQQVPNALLRDLFTTYFGIQDNDPAAFAEEKLVKGMASFMLPDGKQRSGGAGEQRSRGAGVSQSPNLSLSTPPPLQEEEIRWRAKAIGQLIGLDLAEYGLLAAAVQDTPQMRDRAFGYIADFLSAVTERSAVAVLFLEDIHWADKDSLDLLERLAALSSHKPLLIICLARPSLFERRPHWQQRKVERNIHTIPLTPLTEADSGRLVRRLLARLSDLPATLVELIVNAAGGNPYYVEELIKVLIEDGIIIPDAGGWQLRSGDLTRVRIPATLTGVLQSRLDRLPEVERVTLQRAAVVGREFWDTAVQHINRQTSRPYADEQITAALQALMRRDMVYRAPGSVFSGSTAYLFKHAVLREVAYESVLLRDRPTYHRAAGNWLAERSGERVAEYAAPIAAHYELAGQSTEAAEMYELAAMRADDQYNPQAATEYYKRALTLLASMPHNLDWQLRLQERLGRVLKRQGQLVEAANTFHAMHAAAEMEGNLPAQAQAELELADIAGEQGDYAAMLASALRAERLAWLVGADVSLHKALTLKATAERLSGLLDEAVETANQSLELAAILDSAPAMSESLSQLSLAWLASGHVAQAAPHLERLHEHGKRLTAAGQAADAAYAHLLLGRAYLHAGRQQEAIPLLDHALAQYRAAGIQPAISDTLEALACAVCLEEQVEAAADYCREALAIAEATGNGYARLSYQLELGRALLAAAEYEQAKHTLQQLIRAAEDPTRIGRWHRLPEARQLLAAAQNNLDANFTNTHE